MPGSFSLQSFLARRMGLPAPAALPPYRVVLQQAQALLGAAAARGMEVDTKVRQAILQAAEDDKTKAMTPASQDALYSAYTLLVEQTSELSGRNAGKQPFGKALDDAEQLVRYAAEAGLPVPSETADSIFQARTEFNDGKLSDAGRSKFFTAYAAVAKMFGEVTAETIRNASSRAIKYSLWIYTAAVIVLTLLVAGASIYSFIMDANADRIKAAVAEGDGLAIRLHTSVKWTGDPPEDYVKDPCQKIDVVEAGTPKLPGQDALKNLQEFAALIREIRGSAIKLDVWLSKPFHDYLQCDPYGLTCSDKGYAPPKDADRRTQLNAAVTNYAAEVYCKIRSYEEIRTFGTNIREDYIGIYGAVTAYALPICYSLLGAMAFQLRYFAELIRRRTYHFSFAEPARLVTAVIAGAICGLFNPAKGLNLPPLAVAFLVGYGVEVFFKFLDTLTNAFVPNFQASPSQSIGTVSVNTKTAVTPPVPVAPILAVPPDVV